MGRKDGNGVGKPGEQETIRKIKGIEARIEERIGLKGGELSGKAWRTRDKQGNWRNRG
jgi:hypothetical protein